MSRLSQTRRQHFGYTYPKQNNSDITMIQNKRSGMQDNIKTSEMSGAGFMELVRGFYDKGRELMEDTTRGAKYIYDNSGAISDAYTGELGTSLRNMIPDSDNTARPGFAGEKHMILELANGKNGVANFMGPGTQVIKRLKRDDPARTPADMVAKRHDIDYALAQSARTRADQFKQIRDADNRMISSLQKIDANKGDATRNIQAGMRLIQVKKLGEDTGIIGKDKFAGALRNIPDDEKVLLMSNRARLTQQGYGLSLPGAGLKKKILMGISRSKTLPDTKDYVLSGDGVLASFIVDKAIPSITKHLNLPDIPSNISQKVFDMSVKKSGNIGDKLNMIAKNIIPILAYMKLKHMGMRGKGINIKSFSKVPKLQKLMKVALMKSLQGEMSGKGKHSGGSFWSDFKKGFTSVFKPFATIAGPIASTLGVPEIGIPLGVVGNLL